MRWVKCLDRLPTEKDAGIDGLVVVRVLEGIGYSYGVEEFENVLPLEDFEWLEGANE